MASSGSPRLLTNLLTHEKEHAKALIGVLDASGAAVTALLLYQPWLNELPRQINGEGSSVLNSLAHSDVGLRTYTAAVEACIEGLKDLRDLEEGVRNLVRDREILVTRVLKTSNKSSNRDSIFSAPSPSHSTLSLDSYSGKSYGPLGGKSSKLAHWQSELNGCEKQLVSAQRELELKRVSAIRDGLRLRATAMVECGTRWVEAGRAILQLETDDTPLPRLPEVHSDMNKPLPDDVSSLTPSQSASQLEHDLDIHIPPAHAIADIGLPSVLHVLPRRITEENLNASSSSDEEGEMQAVVNPRFGGRSAQKQSAPPVSARRDESPTKPRFFGSIRGLFGSRKASSVSGDMDEAEEKISKARKMKTWDTRTAKNLHNVEPIASPSASVNDLSNPRARRLRKDSPEKRQRRRSTSLDAGVETPLTPSSSSWAPAAPVARKQSGKKKKKRPEAEPFANLSRNSSITSAPATFSPRATSPSPPLPSANGTPSHKRQSSLNIPIPTSTTRSERRASSQGASLMSIVEDVARANRQATLDSAKEREIDRSRTLSGGLISVKAPQSLSKKEIDGLPIKSLLPERKNSTGSRTNKVPKLDSLFQVKASASPTHELFEGLPTGSVVLASSSSVPHNHHHAPTPSHMPPKATSPKPVASNGTASSPPGPSRAMSPSALSPPPLRSALRNGGSRTPSPMSLARSPSPVKGLLVVQAPSPLHLATTHSVPELDHQAATIVSAPPPPVAARMLSLPVDDDDTASMSSYETGHEMFDEMSVQGTPKVPPKEHTLSAPNPTQNGTEVSMSSDSTVANGAVPKRRKSVRVSLRPTFSATPPAIEYDEWHPSENTVLNEPQVGPSSGKKHSWKDGEPPDMWQDSSEEDEEYSTARRLLSRVARKEKKARA